MARPGSAEAKPARSVPAFAWVGGSAIGLAAVVLLIWLVWPSAPGPAPTARLIPPAPSPVTPLATARPAAPSASPPATRSISSAPAAGPATVAGFVIRTATRRQILDDQPDRLAVFRYAANPAILVLDFPSLDEQGLMFDRVAALVEKAGLPRERVVSWVHLRAAIAAHGDTIGTYYYGNDYSAAALARFFALAAADHRTLNPQEQRLRALLDGLGWLRPGVQAGLITLPREGANRYVTRTARDVILTHELSHGEFFSSPAYAAFVRRFWRVALSGAQRDAIRRFLAGEEYDTTRHTLVVNEMQAYLMFTRNPAFFSPADIGMTVAERARLQRAFAAEMPAGWLRDRLVALNARPNGGNPDRPAAARAIPAHPPATPAAAASQPAGTSR